MTTYNHAYSIGFAVEHSVHPEGADVTPFQLRQAILKRLASIDDNELEEACDAPWDTYEEKDEKVN